MKVVVFEGAVTRDGKGREVAMCCHCPTSQRALLSLMAAYSRALWREIVALGGPGCVTWSVLVEVYFELEPLTSMVCEEAARRERDMDYSPSCSDITLELRAEGVDRG